MNGLRYSSGGTGALSAVCVESVLRLLFLAVLAFSAGCFGSRAFAQESADIIDFTAGTESAPPPVEGGQEEIAPPQPDPVINPAPRLPDAPPVQDAGGETPLLPEDAGANSVVQEVEDAVVPPFGSESVSPSPAVQLEDKVGAKDGSISVEPNPGQETAVPPSLMPDPAQSAGPGDSGTQVGTQEGLPEGTLMSSEGIFGSAAAPVERAPRPKSAGPDLYYDSSAAVPGVGQANATGPRKADPLMEPASRFVVVKRIHGAKDTESMLVAAGRALKLERYDSAIEMYDRLYEKNRRDPRILMGRAVAYQKAGRTETALRSYEELLAIDHDNRDALLNMLGLLKGQYPEVSVRRLMALYGEYPDNAAVAAQIGIAQAEMGNMDEAMRYLGVARSLEPNNAQHIFNMAIVYDRAGQGRDAIGLYEQALEADAVYGDSHSVPRDRIYDRLSVLRQH